MFRILVPIKRVPDPAAKLHLQDSQLALDGIRMVLNPYDEVALEEAVRWQESGRADEVIALSVGGPDCDETLRQAMALGAQRAVRIESKGAETPLSIAQAIAASIEQLDIRLVICGLQSSDEESGLVGPMLAALLNWPFLAGAVALQQQGAVIHASCRRFDRLDLIETPSPAVVSADLQLNMPRYARLPAIVAAKRKPVELLARTDSTPLLEKQQLTLPAARPPVRLLDTAEAVATVIEKSLQ